MPVISCKSCGASLPMGAAKGWRHILPVIRETDPRLRERSVGSEFVCEECDGKMHGQMRHNPAQPRPFHPPHPHPHPKP